MTKKQAVEETQLLCANCRTGVKFVRTEIHEQTLDDILTFECAKGHVIMIAVPTTSE